MLFKYIILVIIHNFNLLPRSILSVVNCFQIFLVVVIHHSVGEEILGVEIVVNCFQIFLFL